MSMYAQDLKARRRAKVVELLREGLTTRQISERVGMTPRSVLRVKKAELETVHVQEDSS